MADNLVPQVILDINDPQYLITERFRDKPAILSTQIAERFLKKHQNILRDIGNLRGMLPKSFDEANLGRIYMLDKKGERRPAYLLTRDAFTLLVMGMTGKTAVMWKIRYIEAFNALEQAASAHLSQLAVEAAYNRGCDETLALPVMEAERRKGYLEGFAEGKKLARKEDGLRVLEKVIAYVRKGLTYAEIGKLTGLSQSSVGRRIAKARKLGFMTQTPKPFQAGLPGVM